MTADRHIKRERHRRWRHSERGSLLWHMSKVATQLRGRRNGDITSAQLMSLWQNQRGCCALTGVPMAIASGHCLEAMSVDRIKGELGYTIDNIRLVTWQANSARLIGDDSDLLQFCQLVLINHGFTIHGP